MKKAYLVILLAFAFLCWFGAPITFAAPAFVSSSSFGATASTNNVSTTLNVTANNLVVIGCRAGTTFVAPTNATDTIGNVFTQFAIASNSNDGSMTGYWAISSGTNASDVIRCNFASSRAFRDITAASYSGIATSSPIDATSTSATSTLTATTFTSGPFTTTNANDLIFTLGQNGGGNSMTSAAPGYTIRSNLDVAFIGVADADLNVSSIQTNATMTWSATPASSWEIIVGAFKATAASVPSATAANSLTVGARGLGLLNISATCKVTNSSFVVK